MPGPKLIFGAGGVGATEKGFVYTWDNPEKITELLEILKSYGISDLDSAASYPPGNPWNTETLLGQTEATKDFQTSSKILAGTADGKPLSATNLEASLDKTLHLLGVSKIPLLYAHAPDAKTDMAETAAAFDKQHKAGKFDRLGLCNYTLEQLQEYVAICEKEGYIRPTVVQDQYNALVRRVETFFPFLRKHGVSYVAYSPLAGGLLTGKVTMARDSSHPDHKPLPERTRWAGESEFKLYTDFFDKEHVHGALLRFHDACKRHGVTETEVSLRWLAHHSRLGEKDGIIIGATREEQLRGNVEMIKKGPLPAELVGAADTLHKEANVDDMFAHLRQ